ncbi:LacI family transcriptional regulator [Opitutaceae bacterium TAV4]|nr:LacI family transcriptional regulator [Opitutaceae bacterium TAV4]RRJ99773.1 LacI family transcriptional regulator [Opitutaceae bacterium TAV3]
MNTKTRVSLRQVAARAGVSHSTVSLALRAHPSIPAATRERLLALVEEMGYRPDPMLTALNVYRQSRRGAAFQSVLAWLNAFVERDMLQDNPDCVLYRKGAEARAREAGFVLEEFWLREPGMTPARLAQILTSRQIQGVLLPPMPFSDTDLGMPWERFSVVALGFSHQPVFHMTANAQYRSARLATRNLYRLGHRRIGLFTWPDQEERTDCNFLSGFSCECNRFAMPSLLCSVDSQLDRRERDAVFYENWRAQMNAWIAREHPDALLLPDPIVAERLGLGSKVNARGKRLAVAVLAHYAQHSWFAGIDQNAERTGSAAVDHLIHMIQRNERGRPDLPLRIFVEGVWRDGASAPGKTG